MKTADDVLQEAREQGVRFVRLQFTDILGVNKNVAIPVTQLEAALRGRLYFDGSSIEGFVRIEESDMLLKPDPDTFAIFPWTRGGTREARLICDIYNPDGTPFAGCPRYALKRAVERAAHLGFTVLAGPEAEFYLFKRDAEGRAIPVTNDQASYFDLMPIDLGEDTRRDIVMALEDMGFAVEAAHHEVAPGQHEIDFRYADVVTTADNISTFKLVVRTIAMQHGLHATFMPKPLNGQAGSGMHTNLSLMKDGENAFFDPQTDLGLSQVARQFIGGLIAHVREFTAITNPLVNSYKRLVPGFEAPVYIAWSPQNRSPLIRVPAARGQGTRVELRSPDPACNPYLALAVAIQAGLDGIESGVTPPDPVNENLYEMGPEERLSRGIDVLPGSLEEALNTMAASSFVRTALGDHITDHFIEAKQIEWDVYRQRVHQWELDQYLAIY